MLPIIAACTFSTARAKLFSSALMLSTTHLYFPCCCCSMKHECKSVKTLVKAANMHLCKSVRSLVKAANASPRDAISQSPQGNSSLANTHRAFFNPPDFHGELTAHVKPPPPPIDDIDGAGDDDAGEGDDEPYGDEDKEEM